MTGLLLLLAASLDIINKNIAGQNYNVKMFSFVCKNALSMLNFARETVDLKRLFLKHSE